MRVRRFCLFLPPISPNGSDLLVSLTGYVCSARGSRVDRLHMRSACTVCCHIDMAFFFFMRVLLPPPSFSPRWEQKYCEIQEEVAALLFD